MSEHEAQEDVAETAFWTFDEERKRTGAERDAFKRQYHGALADVKDQKRRADENYKSAMDYSAEAVRHMEEAERLRADVARLHAGATAVIKVLASSPDLCMSPEGLAALAMFQRGDLAGHLT